MTNPVLIKEIRGRMRGGRAYLVLTATLLALGLSSYGVYQIVLAQTSSIGFMGDGGQFPAMGVLVGQCVFTSLVFLALALICAIAPALTAGAVSGEHERKTFDLLVATPLRPASLLFGKLLSALSYIFLILLAAVPLASLSFVFGGVPWLDMLQAFLLLLGFAVTFSVVGLFFSAWLRRTSSATVLSYVAVAALVFGTSFLHVVIGAINREPPSRIWLTLNPFSALASALVVPPGAQMFRFDPFNFMGVMWMIAGGRFDFGDTLPTPLWHYTVAIYAWLTLMLYLISTQLVKPVARFRLWSPMWLLIILLFVVSIAAAPFAYTRWQRAMSFTGIPPPVRLIEPAFGVPPPPIDIMPIPTDTPTPAPINPPVIVPATPTPTR